MKIVQSVGLSRSLPFSLLVLSLYTKALYQKEKHREKNSAKKTKGTIGGGGSTVLKGEEGKYYSLLAY